MLAEEDARKYKERWESFEILAEGWQETDTVPIGEVKRLIVWVLEAILEERPRYKYVYFCRLHSRLYLNDEPIGCEKCQE